MSTCLLGELQGKDPYKILFDGDLTMEHKLGPQVSQGVQVQTPILKH